MGEGVATILLASCLDLCTHPQRAAGHADLRPSPGGMWWWCLVRAVSRGGGKNKEVNELRRQYTTKLKEQRLEFDASMERLRREHQTEIGKLREAREVRRSSGGREAGGGV